MASHLVAAAVASCAVTAAAGASTPALPRPVAADTAPYQVLVDWRAAPALGVESRTPTFTWAPPLSHVAQSAARAVVVAVATGQPAWDSGVVATAANSLTVSDATALAPATAYAVSITAYDGNGTASAPSPNDTFVTALWSSWAATPVWHPNASAALVFVRHQEPLASTSQLVSALAFATANPHPSSAGEVENAKLMSGYRLYVNGVWSGVGPGRQGRCGPVCPIQNDPAPCGCAREHVYDVIDVTAAVAGGDGNNEGAGECAIAPPPHQTPAHHAHTARWRRVHASRATHASRRAR